jgi:hypothetical protein
MAEHLPPVVVVEQLLRRICAQRGYVTKHLLKQRLWALGYELEPKEVEHLLSMFYERYFLTDDKQPDRYLMNPGLVYLAEGDYYSEIYDLDTIQLYELLATHLANSSQDILDMLAELAERAVMSEDSF